MIVIEPSAWANSACDTTWMPLRDKWQAWNSHIQSVCRDISIHKNHQPPSHRSIAFGALRSMGYGREAHHQFLLCLLATKHRDFHLDTALVEVVESLAFRCGASVLIWRPERSY